MRPASSLAKSIYNPNNVTPEIRPTLSRKLAGAQQGPTVLGNEPSEFPQENHMGWFGGVIPFLIPCLSNQQEKISRASRCPRRWSAPQWGSSRTSVPDRSRTTRSLTGSSLSKPRSMAPSPQAHQNQGVSSSHSSMDFGLTWGCFCLLSIYLICLSLVHLGRGTSEFLTSNQIHRFGQDVRSLWSLLGCFSQHSCCFIHPSGCE